MRSSFGTVSILSVVLFLPLACANAATETFSVILRGSNVGRLVAETDGPNTRIDYDYKDNGRGPTLTETVTTDESGHPRSWAISGTTTFGGRVDERFEWLGGTARWTDPMGDGTATMGEPKIYVAAGASPWAFGLYARALLNSPDRRMAALPSGTLVLEPGETLSVSGTSDRIDVTAYALVGTDLHPTYLLLDQSGALFAQITPGFVVLRQGYEGEESRLREIAARLSEERYFEIQKRAAHRYGAPVRIRNVRVFQPTEGVLSPPVSVAINGNEIAAIDSADAPATPGEVTIDGEGGSLVAGLYDMHVHFGQDDALLNLLAGVTSVRDMGNNKDVLDGLVERIEAGKIGGPRVTRSGFIEGKSPFSSSNGITVDSEVEAIEAVRWYGARGYWQVKIYSSVRPEWVPAIAREAHRLGMRVAGHVPAFTNADEMIAAGFDEISHINQLMFGWVLDPSEDTRTQLRVTSLKRFGGLDLDAPRVRRTIDATASRNVAVDPTLGIAERFTLDRDGQTPPGLVDYFDHMPVGFQRTALRALADTSAPGDDQAYRGAFDTILETVGRLHDRGIFIVMGTDTGGAFTLHRELELYQRTGMSRTEILKRATFDSARYLGQEQRLGSIEKGKLADFFLIPGDPTQDLKAIKTIRMVVKDGVVYFPSEIYPSFGIQPFVDAPAVHGAAAAR